MFCIDVISKKEITKQNTFALYLALLSFTGTYKIEKLTKQRLNLKRTIFAMHNGFFQLPCNDLVYSKKLFLFALKLLNQ